MLTIQIDSAVPLADQVESGIRLAIASGELVKDDPLPTVRQLAADLGINLNTVARAYKALEAAGLVLSRRRRGTVVRASVCLHSAKLPEVQLQLTSRMRETLAEMRLGGFDREQAQELFDSELANFWPKETRR